MQRIGIFGGSFNPVHIAHLRFAIEIRERLGLDRIDIIPCAVPPHKPSKGMLPFSLRHRLLEAACSGLPHIAVSDIENRLEGISFTYRTLQEYRKAEPDAELFFILGTLDLLTLPSWHRGDELTELASLITVPRVVTDFERVSAFVTSFWKNRAVECTPPTCEGSACWRFDSGNTLLYLPIPHLEISATLIRQIWREGRSLSMLVPPSAEALLNEHRAEVDLHWT